MNAAAKSRQTSSSSRVRSLPPSGAEVTHADVEILTSEESLALDDRNEFENLLRSLEEGAISEVHGWWKSTIAAAKLRHHKGWKDSEYRSFAEYCSYKLGWEQSTAYDYAFHGEFLIRLESFGVPQSLWPTRQSHITAIRKLKEEEQPIVWQQLASSSESKITASSVKDAVDEYLGQSESGASFEDLQAKYSALPNTRLVKTKNGRFNYAVEQSGRTRSLHSLKEVEAAFEDCKEWAEYRATANASGTGAAAKQFDFSNVDRAKLNPTIPPTEETTEDSIAPTDETAFDTNSDEGAEVIESREETIELPLVESVEESQVEAIDVADEESDEEYESPSFHVYEALRTVVRRFSALSELGWSEAAIGNATDTLYSTLTELAE